MCRARPVVAISSIETAGGGADRRRRDSGQTAVRELDPPVDVGGTVPAGRFLLLAPPASQRERRGVWNLEGQPRHADAVAVTRGQLRSEHASPAASFRFLLFQLQTPQPTSSVQRTSAGRLQHVARHTEPTLYLFLFLLDNTDAKELQIRK
jgi:hypothetical protein